MAQKANKLEGKPTPKGWKKFLIKAAEFLRPAPTGLLAAAAADALKNESNNSLGAHQITKSQPKKQSKLKKFLAKVAKFIRPAPTGLLEAAAIDALKNENNASLGTTSRGPIPQGLFNKLSNSKPPERKTYSGQNGNNRANPTPYRGME